MISMLIVTQDKQSRETYANDFCNRLGINPFDITVFQPQTSLGIEDVREIQKKALFKPLKSKEKALVLHDAHLATTEAQNALLKLLEEPPLNTHIVLTAASLRSFLPTILSRCKIIELDAPQQKFTPDDQTTVDSLLTAPIGETLLLAQELTKNKEEAISKLESLVYAAHTRMQENPQNISYARITQVLSNTYTQAINTKINLRFLLEHALLTLQSKGEESV